MLYTKDHKLKMDYQDKAPTVAQYAQQSVLPHDYINAT